MLTILCSKTQAAVEYCWRFKDANPDFHIFWIHAGSTVSFDVDYRKLARRLGLMGHTFNVDNDDMRSDPGSVVVHQDGGRVPLDVPPEEPSEIPPTYDSIKQG